MIAGLQHPNIVLLYGAGDDNGVAWAAMELLPRSLSQELERAAASPAMRSAASPATRASGSRPVAAQGIVHRDIKPSNLLRDARRRASRSPTSGSPRTCRRSCI